MSVPWHHKKAYSRKYGIGFYMCARQGALTKGCKSLTGPVVGTVSDSARVSVARPNLKEADSKALT